MKHLTLAIGVIIFAQMAIAARTSNELADEVLFEIVQQLKSQGYARMDGSQTWLGRTRIIAQGDSVQREIVIDPRTGEILMDAVFTVDGQRVQHPRIANVPNTN